MQRLPDWEERIVRYLEPLHAAPFQWGQHDCCTFAAGAVIAMTGEDAMAEFRGRYSTARGSVYALRKFGAGDLVSTLDTKLARVEPHLAHRGDILMSAGGLGVIWTAQGQTVALMVGLEGQRDGLVRFARREWATPIAWRVPYA